MIYALTRISSPRHENFVGRLNVAIENALDALIPLVPVERLGIPAITHYNQRDGKKLGGKEIKVGWISATL